MVARVLTWNLKHGRAVPSAGRDLFEEFATALGGWEWDAALLQEVPPWWVEPLASRLDAEQRFVLTSRNAGLRVRRALAVRWPDLVKSNGGGANAILVRGDAIVEHRIRRLCIWPERRWMHAVLLHSAGAWVANLHAGGPMREARLAAGTARSWAGDASLVLAGDFNVRRLTLDGFVCAAGHEVDYVFVRGFSAESGAEVLDRGHLSDHAPVAVTIAPGRSPAPPATPSR
jgi:endonuclease/exonuclease/phosphatase family metal-dependent hydrolase